MDTNIELGKSQVLKSKFLMLGWGHGTSLAD